MAPDDGRRTGSGATLARRDGALAPYDTGRYFNFVEEPFDVRDALGDESYRRLQAVKAQHDPDDVFRANHPIHSN